MRTKVTLVLLFLNVVLFFFIFHFERDWRTEQAALEVRRRVLGAEAADIRILQVDGDPAVPGGSFRLERRGDDWFLTSPLEWPANLPAVTRMTNELQSLEHETSFRVADLAKNGQSLADYGLDHPKLTITFTSGGTDTTGAAPVTTTLRVGDATQVGDRLYLLSPDGTRIHVVDRELADDFSLPLAQIRADTLLTIPVFEAGSLTLQSGGGAAVPVGIRRDGDRWSFETPILSRANENAVELAINRLDALRVKSFIGQNPPSPPPAAAPTLRATIEGNRRSETLLLGEPVARPVAGPAPAEVDYYGQFEDGEDLRPAIFVVAVPTGLVKTLRDAQEDLRERRILDFNPADVTAITLAAPNQPDLTLQRLEAPGGGGGGDAWQIVRPNAAGPQTADRAAVRRLLDQLTQLSAENFQSDAPQAADLENWGFNQPERIVTLSLAGTASAPGTQLTLQIGLSGQRDGPTYARLAGQPTSIYTVNSDILPETPVTPLAWRDRLLWDLPAGKSIVSLTLTDLAGPRVVYQRTLAGGETWDQALAAEAPARRKALTALVKGLRTLRAQSFLPDEGSDQVNAGGEERPWRYRLDLTLSETAGAGGKQTSVHQLWLTERIGGTAQYARSPEFGAVFALEQPLIDSLWTLTYGARDPGAPAAP